MLSFLAAILLGTVLLLLPISTREAGSMGVLNALFTATSATCVTGLIVVDTGTYFTPFGQVVILILIQLGGLGIMTMSTFFLIMLGKRLTIRDRIILQDSIGESKVEGLKGLIKLIVGTTVLLELMGTAILTWRFQQAYGYEPFRALKHGIFHSVSAFCNAGFSLYPDSLMRFGGDWWITGTMGSLVFLGGIGFVVLYNVTHYYFWRKDRLQRGRIRLQAKIALLTSGALFLVLFIFLLSVEWSNTLQNLSLEEKLSRSFYQSVTPRTAGFNTMEISKMKPGSLWLTIFMMFVGASPSGTGGGIKTCTFLVLLAAVSALVTGKGQVTVFHRSIARDIVSKSISIVIIALALIFIASCFLFLSEADIPKVGSRAGFMCDILFETVSAFGTVGLSTGVTPYLSALGRVMIMITMYVGRISPLALALFIGSGTRQLTTVRYPDESILVG